MGNIWYEDDPEGVVSENDEVMFGDSADDCCCDDDDDEGPCTCCVKIWVGGTEDEFCSTAGECNQNFCGRKPMFLGPDFDADLGWTWGDGLFAHGDIWLPLFGTVNYNGENRCEYKGIFGCPPGGGEPPGSCGHWDPMVDYWYGFTHYIVYMPFDVNTGCWKLHIEKQMNFVVPCYSGTPGQPAEAVGLITMMWSLGYNCIPNERCPCMPNENSWQGLPGCYCEGCPPQGVMCMQNPCRSMGGQPKACGDVVQIENCTVLQQWAGCCCTEQRFAPPAGAKPIMTPYWFSCYWWPPTGPGQCLLAGDTDEPDPP